VILTRLVVAGLGLIMACSLAFADATIPTRDLAGASDNKLLPRYDGSFIVSFERQQYGELNLPLSPLERTARTDADNNTVFAPKQSNQIEGAYTRLVYLLPDKRSPLEVLRNYQDVLAKLGGEVLFECKGEDCGGSATRASSGGGGDTSLMMHFFTEKTLKDPAFSNGNCALTSRITDQRYFSGRIPIDGDNAFIAVHTYTVSDGGSYCGAFNGRSVAVVQIVDPKKRDQKMVVIKADEMAKAIGDNGRIALYGIFFATDKADLTPESDPTLTEIASLLQKNPGLTVVIVGHTDNAGNFDYNIDLSKRRAASVVGALVKRFHLPAERLKSAGVGMVAPAASNATEDGRAKNRRVEIVRLN
jgi:outer membrane protein OmpA-like peptidoglycan-associated protein